MILNLRKIFKIKCYKNFSISKLYRYGCLISTLFYQNLRCLSHVPLDLNSRHYLFLLDYPVMSGHFQTLLFLKGSIKCYLCLQAIHVAAPRWEFREGIDDLIYNYSYLFMCLLFSPRQMSPRAESSTSYTFL